MAKITCAYCNNPYSSRHTHECRRMREAKKINARIEEFKGYTINDKLMKIANPDAIFMHCLPAYYGYEVTKEIAHGTQSVIFDEAENRLWAQIGIMVTLLK